VAANGGEQRDSNIYELKKKGCDFFVIDEEHGVKIYIDTDNESRCSSPLDGARKISIVSFCEARPPCYFAPLGTVLNRVSCSDAALNPGSVRNSTRRLSWAV